MSAVIPKDPYEVVRKRMAKKLVGFTNDFPSGLDSWGFELSRPSSSEFPVPELVLLALRDIMGFRWSGIGEKVRWSIYACVVGEPVVFELAKFGFGIRFQEGSALDVNRVKGQLKGALKELEKAMKSFSEKQIQQGHVTIANNSGEFYTRYQFFRKLAGKAYKKARKRPPQSQISFTGFDMEKILNHQVAADREGFFHSVAMVDAYFSYLEHLLVLLRAFTGKPLGNGEFRGLLAAKWDEKLKFVADFYGNQKFEEIIGRLRTIKERVRNPFAHGGVENDGGSIFFHTTVGAIPGNLSRFGDSVRFSWIPIESERYDSFCATFDELDALLASGSMKGPHRLVKACIDPSFDPKTLAKYAAAINGDIEGFIEGASAAWEAHANMEA